MSCTSFHRLRAPSKAMRRDLLLPLPFRWRRRGSGLSAAGVWITLRQRIHRLPLDLKRWTPSPYSTKLWFHGSVFFKKATSLFLTACFATHLRLSTEFIILLLRT